DGTHSRNGADPRRTCPCALRAGGGRGDAPRRTRAGAARQGPRSHRRARRADPEGGSL
ncbi:MAG: hypothetical protein AVDCRST_MAG31-156, partial [uncultured Sphingomonas sp.]